MSTPFTITTIPSNPNAASNAYNLFGTPQISGSSAQLVQTPATLGTSSYQTPKATTPTTPTNNNTNSSSGGSSSNTNSHINPATGNWDDNYFASQQQQSAPSLDPQLAAAFDSINSQLDNEATLANNQYGTNQQDLDATFSNANQTLDATKTARDAQDQASQDQLKVALRNAQDELSRNQAAQQQMAQALFGSGSSAGGAFNELAQQQYYRSQGQLGQTNQTEIGKLIAEQAQFANWYDDYKRNLQQQLITGKAKLKDDLDQSIQGINMQKAQVGMSKAQAQANLISQYAAQTQQLQQDILEHDLAVDAMKQEVQANLQANIAQQNGTQYTPDTSGYQVSNPLQISTPKQSNGISFVGNPYSTNAKDPLQQLNPYYG